MPKFRFIDTDGNEYFPNDRIRELEKSARDTCMKKGCLRKKPPQDKRFEHSEDESSFFKKLAFLLYEYEQAMKPSLHVLQEVLEENRSDLEKIKADLGFRFSESAVDKVIAILKNDQEKSLEKSKKSDEVNEAFCFEPGKHVSKGERNRFLLRFRDLYQDLSPLKRDSQIAYNLSLLLSHLEIYPSDPETIRKVFVNSNKAPAPSA